MRALLLDGKLKLVEDYPTPEPPPGEALIRVNVAGVCNTDLELVKGYMQFRGAHRLRARGPAWNAESAGSAGGLKGGVYWKRKRLSE